jgi:tetratricopeptide (TPR) repeat protein
MRRTTARANHLLGALRLQQAGRLAEAAAAYRAVLAFAPDLPDAVHMLGATLLQAGEPRRALAHLRRAAELFGWSLPAAQHNLSLAIAAALAHADRARTAALWEQYDRWRDDRAQRHDPAPVGVGVVVACAEDRALLASSLASVFAQTHRDLEIAVLVESAAAATDVRALSERSPFPLLSLRAGADDRAAAIDGAARRLRTPYVNVLEAQDRFAPTRIAAMVDAVARRGLDWGFSRALPIGADGIPLAPESSERAARVAGCADRVIAGDTVGTAFLSSDPTPSPGTLFFSRALFDRLGGCADLGAGRCRDFCLRAALLAEPAFVASPEYEYRIDASRDTRDSDDADEPLARFCAAALTMTAADNRFAPIPAVWGARFFELALARERVPPLPPAVLRAFADYALARLDEDGSP